MKKSLVIPLFGSALAAWAPHALAREVVVLPGVVGSVGVLSGVDTQGPGTLTVGAQDINTSNDAGGGLTTSAANTATVDFTASSTVTGFTGTVGSTFLRINAGATGNTVTFKGPVYASTFSVSGAGTVNFNGGFTSNTGGAVDFAGDGFINVGPGGTLRGAITNTAGARTGTLTLNNGSIVDGAVGAASGLKRINLVGGNALITGQAHAGSFSLGTNTLNVAGALAIPTGGSIDTTIFSTGLYGKIVPVGAASIGGAVQVNVIVTGPIANGTSFNIVEATSGTDGSVITAVSTTPLYAFTAAPTVAGTIKITTAQVPLAVIVTPVTPAVPGVPSVPAVVAPVIDALPSTPGTAPVLVALTQVPTATGVALALAQLAPSNANIVAPRVGYGVTEQFQDLWSSTMEAAAQDCAPDEGREGRPVRRKGEACDPYDARFHLWGAALGHWGRQDERSGIEGFDADTQGVMVAGDTPIGGAMRFGAGLRYARTEIEGARRLSEARIDTYQVTTYLAYAPGDFYANAALVYGFDEYHGARSIRLPSLSYVANANYRGAQSSAFGAAGYHIRLGDGRTVVTPNASFQYTHLTTEAFRETGAGGVSLAAQAQKYDFLQSELGAKVTRVMPWSATHDLRLDVHGDWRRAFGDKDAVRSTVAFTGGGSAFTVAGLRPDRNLYEVGGGARLGGGRSPWSVEAIYDYQWRRDGYSAQQGMIKVVLKLGPPTAG